MGEWVLDKLDIDRQLSLDFWSNGMSLRRRSNTVVYVYLRKLSLN